MIFNQFSRKHIVIMSVLGFWVATLFVICYVASSGVDSSQLSSRYHRCWNSEVDTTNSTLELVHIVFRHGPRTPVDTYPKDPYIKDKFHPTGWGHVTNKGKQELFEIGEWLNRRYGNFMEPYYSPDSVHAQATASPRALMSLSTVLASMFPPKDTAMDWNPEFNWQPIPILSEPLEQDTLLLVRTPCPRYFEARDEVMHRPEVIAELAQYKSLLENLTELTGMPVSSADDVNSLYITLQAEHDFGLKLPAWTKHYYPEKMQFMAEQSYIYNAYTPEMQKIKGGPFLKKMFEEMLQKRSNKLSPKDRKLFIYTGHDWTVGNILSALNVWKRQMPRFSVMAIFELHKHRHTGEYYVEVFLRNDEKGCLTQLKIPVCGLKCSLDQLIELSVNVLPNESYKERCSAKNSNYVEPPPRPVDQSEAQ